MVQCRVCGPLARLALSLGLYDRCFCRGGIWSGAYAAGLTASRGNNPSLRPSVPRRRFPLVCPPCIRHVVKWASSALWAVVPIRLLHRRPYHRCLRSRSRACRSNRRQWLLSGWWVGDEFLRHPHPNPAGHSSVRTLLTRRETLMSSVCRRRASAERYPRK